jgi:glycopeptide antibiotics resistance protein
MMTPRRLRDPDGDVRTVLRSELEALGSRRRQALAVVWLLLLLLTVAGVLLPGSIIDGLDPFTWLDDTTEHLAAFILLAFLPPLWVSTRGGAVSFCVFVLCLALSLEWIQLIAPDRDFEFSDIAMNVVGSIIGSIAGVLLRQMARSYKWFPPAPAARLSEK